MPRLTKNSNATSETEKVEAPLSETVSSSEITSRPISRCVADQEGDDRRRGDEAQSDQDQVLKDLIFTGAASRFHRVRLP